MWTTFIIFSLSTKMKCCYPMETLFCYETTFLFQETVILLPLLMLVLKACNFRNNSFVFIIHVCAALQ